MLSLHLNELNNSAIVILSATTYWDELSIASESFFFLWIISFLLYWAQSISFYVTCLQGSCWILSYWPILCALALRPTPLNSAHVYRKERWMMYMWYSPEDILSTLQLLVQLCHSLIISPTIAQSLWAGLGLWSIVLRILLMENHSNCACCYPLLDCSSVYHSSQLKQWYQYPSYMVPTLCEDLVFLYRTEILWQIKVLFFCSVFYYLIYLLQ